MKHSQDTAALGAALRDKLRAAEEIVAEGCGRFAGQGLVLAYTGGKDSTLMLWIARRACRERGLAMPRCVFIDEGDGFPEIEAFVPGIRADWGLDIAVVRNDDVLAQTTELGAPVEVARLDEENRAELARMGFVEPSFPLDPESKVGNHLMKTAVLLRFLKRNNVAALATAIRRDEHESRRDETHFSPRTDPDHIRVHPILDFTERDVWDLTLGMDIPFCPLYRLGYRSLGTRSGTVRFSDVPAWEQDLENTTERGGRAQDKESVMEQLRALGYM